MSGAERAQVHIAFSIACRRGFGEILATREECDWDIQFAHDINEHGWMICQGQRDDLPNPRMHALLVIPFEDPIQCPEDVDRDGEVEVDDLLIVLAEWGNCPCLGDVNDDCEVDVDDLLAILAVWGECGAPSGSVPQTVEDCIERFGYEDPVALEKCIEAVTGNGP